MATDEEKPDSWQSQALRNVAGDSVATVNIAGMFTGAVLLVAGFDPWIACGFPGGICILYSLRSLFDHRHKRQIAELEVKKIEAEQGKIIRAKTQKALTRRRGPHGTP